MISLIIGIILLIIGIIILAISISYGEERVLFMSIFCIIFTIAIVPISFAIGRTPTKNRDKYLIKKEYIERQLNDPTLYAIEKAQEYNNYIQMGNNYWCRFNIEDRSEFIIDIDKYIKGDN